MTSTGSGNGVLLTDQQRLAVTTRNYSVVLSSGAGCGKTHVLTERYLAHLRDDGAEVGQIVAITFTDRAARQMRGRIRAAVVKHLHAASSVLDAATWSRHLQGLETAPISTIHSFCGNLLRQFAFDAGLDPQFDVLEEVLAVNVRDDAVDDCLQKLLTARTETAEDLRQLVLIYGWRQASDAITSLLGFWDAADWQRWLDRTPEVVAAAWQREAREKLLPRYVDYLLAAKPYIVRLLTLLERNPARPGRMADNVRTLLEGLPRLASSTDLAATVGELAEAAKVGSIGKKAWPDPDIYEPIKEAMEKFRNGLRSLGLERFAVPNEGIGEAALVGRRFLHVATAVMQAYQDRKQTLALVDFQDLLILARDLLRDRAEVRARVQDRYRFVLIDELQDTDPVQMEFVEYLCGGGMTAGKLFAVGDSKQSIYRFRGAEVQLFQELRRRVPHAGRQQLTVNFRSQPAILDFANALFARRLIDFEPLVANEPQVNPGPCIEFLWPPRAEKGNVAEGRVTEADWIARRIATLVAPGAEALVVDRSVAPQRLRAVRPGDIVLLFRSMSNVHLYEAALRENGLHYYLVGGRAFFAQQEIYDILNLLRSLENPQDSVSLAGTLRSPFCCLSDETLFVLARHPDGLWTGLYDEALDLRLPADQRERVARARRFLHRWRGLKDRLPIAGLLNAVFADSGFDAAMRFEKLGDRKLANLWKLLDLARTFDRSGLFGLAEFIGRLGDLVRTQPREEQAATQPENADVIRLMSIHQAKGLEFPVVIVPDLAATWRGPPPPAAAWDPELGCIARPPKDEEGPPFSDFPWRLFESHSEVEDWHEELRTLYVACTRARDYLVLAAALKEGSFAENAWMLALSERFDLTTGRCVAPDVAEDRKPLVRIFDELRPLPATPGLRHEEPRPVLLPEVPLWLDPNGTTRDDEDIAPEDLDDGPPTRDQLASSQRSHAEQTVRSVLGAWDFNDPNGWRPLLTARAAGMSAEELNKAADILVRFAASELRTRLAGAAVFHAAMPYVFDSSQEKKKGATLPAIRGIIDCLWQDAQGRWHLAGFVWNASSLDAAWDDVVFAAAAVRGQLGPPLTLTLFDLPSGEPAREAAGRFSLARLLSASLSHLSVS
jgi:ATP-dependent helicase/nuclease subunit A